MAAPLLEIKNLSVEFRTTMGPLRAVDGGVAPGRVERDLAQWQPILEWVGP